MPAQKRSLAADEPSTTTASKYREEEEKEEEEVEEEEGGEEQKQQEQPELPKREDDSEDEEGGSEAEKDEFVFVKLADIRKEVQCPICLGIIRKTRTVMECLHRFCRECIDKSMRLGNNECPACRTHCASRRSLRDDPNYDALIAALYPDIDKYEEEELAFHEEEKNRNKKIQASIAETFRRQSEALGRKKSTTRTRRSQRRSSYGHNSYQRGQARCGGRGTSFAASEDEEEEDANGNDGNNSSSADEPSPNRRTKRRRRWGTPRSSPARMAGNADTGGAENDDVETRDNRGTSPLQVGNREVLAWGRGGVRSQTRHGISSGANGRFVKGGRITKMVEHIRNLDENDNEFGVHLTLLPTDEQSAPSLRRPYICCRPSLSIGHLCQYIALQIKVNDEEVELFVRKPRDGSLEPAVVKVGSDPGRRRNLQVLEAHESLAGLRDSFTNARGDLELVYHLKMHS